MPRSIWNGAISFGLVNVPVQLFSSTESKDVRFHQFEEGTGKRIDYRRFADDTDREVDYDDIVKGHQLADGRYVMLDKDELESVEPGKTRTIDIEDFVSLDDIDPVYFEKSYYLAPSDGDKAYVLLRETLKRTERVGIARFVMRTKQYLAAIRPSGDVLVLETMFFGDEVRDPGELDLPTDVKPSKRELDIAEQLVESMTVDFDPSAYEDTYRERVLELIERKAEGEAIEIEPRDEEVAPVIDLMEALKASLDKGRHPSRSGKDEGRGKDDDGLDELTKDELYDRAAEADIAGRSKMTKGELVKALRAALREAS